MTRSKLLLPIHGYRSRSLVYSPSTWYGMSCHATRRVARYFMGRHRRRVPTASTYISGCTVNPSESGCSPVAPGEVTRLPRTRALSFCHPGFDFFSLFLSPSLPFLLRVPSVSTASFPSPAYFLLISTVTSTGSWFLPGSSRSLFDFSIDHSKSFTVSPLGSLPFDALIIKLTVYERLTRLTHVCQSNV